MTDTTLLTYDEFVEEINLEIENIVDLVAELSPTPYVGQAAQWIQDITAAPGWAPFVVSDVDFFAHNAPIDYEIQSDVDAFQFNTGAAGTTNLVNGDVGSAFFAEYADDITVGGDSIGLIESINAYTLTGLFRQDFGSGYFTEAYGLTLVVDGHTKEVVSVYDSHNVDLHHANADEAVFDLDNVSGQLYVGSLVGGEIIAHDFSGTIEADNARGAYIEIDDSQLSVLDFEAADEMALYIDDSHINQGFVWGDEVTAVIDNSTFGTLVFRGGEAELFVDDSQGHELEVGANSYLHLNDSLIDFTELGVGTKASVADSKSIFELGGENTITFRAGAEGLVFGDNYARDYIEIEVSNLDEDGGNETLVTADLNWYDQVTVGNYTADAGVFALWGELQVGTAEIIIGVGENPYADDIGLVGISHPSDYDYSDFGGKG